MEPLQRIRELEEVDRDLVYNESVPAFEPVVLRGLVRDWPTVAAARQSPEALARELIRLGQPVPVRAFVGEPEIGGRFFYTPALDSLNFQVVETRLDRLLSTIVKIAEDGGKQSVYLGSTPTPQILPQFAERNPLPLLAGKPTEPRIWIGTNSRIAPHYDESENIACVVGGRRTFTLFPTDQIANLYVGPIDRTVAGQATSMVDLANPDFERFPRFREALRHARIAELEPGDAIYIPPLWWHGVQSQGALNVLVNYWWSDDAPDAGSPLHALGHALLTISQMDERKRRAWRQLFDHYVFRLDGDPTEHIPAQAKGILEPSTPQVRQVIKQFLVQALRNS